MILIVTTLNFKDVIDLLKWRPLSSIPFSNTNFGLIVDYRNNEDRSPFIYIYNNTTIQLINYNPMTDGQNLLTVINIGSPFTFGVFMPAQGPRGTIAAGATTSSFTLTTALPATVGVNQLANRGDGRGFKVRVIGNAGGSSGKTEERLVVANTAGTTPTINVDTPFSFTPANGDAYEFLSGKIYLIGNSNVANAFKSYDILTNFTSAGLSVTNLPASWSDASMVGLDELYVPFDMAPGQGFFGNLVATATGAASLTGQATGGDAGVVINQYRNFQIRIIQDTATPTAVGQRRNITSHTAGPSPVYTVPAWAVTPSATASYVIENNGNRIIMWTNGTTQTSTYTISGDAWDANVTFAVRPVAPGTNLFSHQAFSIEPDVASPSNARHSFIFAFRAQNADLFDIAGAATGLWTTAVTYGGGNVNTGAAGVSSVHDPATNQGRYMYVYAGSSSQTMYRFDMKNRMNEPFTPVPIPTGPVSAGLKLLGYALFKDGNTKLAFITLDMFNAAQSAAFHIGIAITR